jgi:DNA (cytosine-5)-methyltransferase 1
MNSPFPVIDIFAGPGGLGEGFSSLINADRSRKFKIGLSIEKDELAHQTLRLRSFFRQFEFGKVPAEYYSFVRGEISINELYEAHPEQARHAADEAWCITLGKEPAENVENRVNNALNGSKKWVLIGGPPCQAYSLVGRSRNGGIDPDDHRVYLYREYYRFLAVHNPPVFVMENVKGLLSSKVDGGLIFRQILSDLRNPAEAFRKLKGNGLKIECPGYHIYSLVKKPSGYDLESEPDFTPEDFIIKAEKYGIPQARHRIILLGIRKDFELQPSILKESSPVKLDDVLARLPRLRSGLSKEEDSPEAWRKAISKLTRDGILRKVDSELVSKINKVVESLTFPQKDRGGEFVEYEAGINYNEKWYLDPKLKGVCNHSSRAHIISDLHRYMFAACYASLKKTSPKLEDLPEKLLPAHKNVDDAIANGKFNDRFRVQLADRPATTVTSHIAKDGHYYIHPDPTQCRSLTVREAARIQTFPDNYYFCGPRTSQYAQVGNAVPPILARQIAEVVFDVLSRINKSTQTYNPTGKPNKQLITY